MKIKTELVGAVAYSECLKAGVSQVSQIHHAHSPVLSVLSEQPMELKIFIVYPLTGHLLTPAIGH